MYLLSFFTDKNHPHVKKIMAESKKIEVNDQHGKYIPGRSDSHEVPVYQTKWLKFGLRVLDITASYAIPLIPDNYSSLFWLDYKELHGDTDSWTNDKYPYIGWARDHSMME